MRTCVRERPRGNSNFASCLGQDKSTKLVSHTIIHIIFTFIYIRTHLCMSVNTVALLFLSLMQRNHWTPTSPYWRYIIHIHIHIHTHILHISSDTKKEKKLFNAARLWEPKFTILYVHICVHTHIVHMNSTDITIRADMCTHTFYIRIALTYIF
jgi:hypothetical protein